MAFNGVGQKTRAVIHGRMSEDLRSLEGFESGSLSYIRRPPGCLRHRMGCKMTIVTLCTAQQGTQYQKYAR